MNRLYVVTLILALLVFCPAPSASAAQSAMSEQDMAAVLANMANMIEGMKTQLKQMEDMYRSGEALRSLEQAEENLHAMEGQVARDPESRRAYEKKLEEIRAAKAAMQDPERLREIEKLREQIRELEAAQTGKPAP